MSQELQNAIEAQFRESLATKERLLADAGLMAGIARAAQLCIDAARAGRRVFLAGNGGSAADAQHIAAEFVARFYIDRRALPAMALTTDTSVITAVSNDYGFEHLFSRQLEAQAVPGDVFIGISTSGNSPNVLRALQACPDLGVARIGLTGSSGGRMREHCELCLCVPSDDTPRIQESHILIGHALCASVEQALFGNRQA